MWPPDKMLEDRLGFSVNPTSVWRRQLSFRANSRQKKKTESLRSVRWVERFQGPLLLFGARCAVVNPEIVCRVNFGA